MDFLFSVVGIVLINLTLSADNLVVIGLAAHRLERAQRRVAILVGCSVAAVLRIVLTAAATTLLLLPGLKAIGGVLLLFIGFKLLKEEEESAEGVKVAATMRGAIVTILVADMVMSVDNVLGVAGAARGDLGLLVFGLVLSTVVLLVGGNIVADLMSRLWWLVYLGAGVIAWTGADMLMDEPVLADMLVPIEGERLLIALAIAAATLGLAHYVHRHRPARARLRAVAVTETIND